MRESKGVCTVCATLEMSFLVPAGCFAFSETWPHLGIAVWLCFGAGAAF